MTLLLSGFVRPDSAGGKSLEMVHYVDLLVELKTWLASENRSMRSLSPWMGSGLVVSPKLGEGVLSRESIVAQLMVFVTSMVLLQCAY